MQKESSNPAIHTPLLEKAVALDATDLHLKAGSPPIVRISGRIEQLSTTALTADETRQIVRSMLTEDQYDRLLAQRELDLSVTLGGKVRFRVNCHFEKGQHAASVRLIKQVLPAPEELGLPAIIKDLALKRRGLVLVTGPTGSGRSTTQAALIDYINKNRSCLIVTIEDTIEYVHSDNKAFIRQREVGIDTHSFSGALQRVLRQDPDVIVIGEMPDLETISACLTAAETGHLVIATLPFNTAAETVNRIIDAFSSPQKEQIRVQLAATLEAVLAQQLIPRADGNGLILACELMIGTPAIHNLIREAKTHSLYSCIQTGRDLGMISMTTSLATLYHEGLISFDDAVARAADPHEFRSLIKRDEE